MRRIDKREPKVKDLNELEICVSELKDVDLEEVGEIDEHIVARLLLSAGYIETHSDDVHILSPRREAML